MLKKADQLLSQYSYLIFLVALVFWMAFIPLFKITGIEDLVEFIVTNLVIISSSYFLYNATRFKFVNILSIFTLLFDWLSYFSPGNIILEDILKALFLFLLMAVTIHFMRKIFNSKIVDINVIYAAISGYVMLAIIMSILCMFTNDLYPGSFNIPLADGRRIMDYAYFTIVTMSTLGYGDVLPIIEESKSLTIFIVLVGQFYMTILMALLIGKFLSQRKGN